MNESLIPENKRAKVQARNTQALLPQSPYLWLICGVMFGLMISEAFHNSMKRDDQKVALDCAVSIETIRVPNLLNEKQTLQQSQRAQSQSQQTSQQQHQRPVPEPEPEPEPEPQQPELPPQSATQQDSQSQPQPQPQPQSETHLESQLQTQPQSQPQPQPQPQPQSETQHESQTQTQLQSESPQQQPQQVEPQPETQLPPPCKKLACDTATTKESCNEICSCKWTNSFCYADWNGYLIGPKDPKPVRDLWDGTYDTFPKPLPKGFASTPLPEAKGKFAYVTMISPFVPWLDHTNERKYSCLGLALMNSIKHTNPDTSAIDLVVVVLISDDDHRFFGETLTDNHAKRAIGEEMYKAFQSVGVTKFKVWKEMKSRTISSGSWKQAFSKLNMWSLVEYERIVFLDSDKIVFRNLDHLFYQEGDFLAPGDWNCRGWDDTFFPAGGFWVLRPSTEVLRIIEEYLAGDDPCGELWYQGDQIMPRLLFTDVSEWAGPHNSLSSLGKGASIARWDGDVGMIQGNDIVSRVGRCSSWALYDSHPTHRIDVVVPADSSSPAYIPPGSTWIMLNSTYDISVGGCEETQFINVDDRYGLGKNGWETVNPFSVHMSCILHKPRCVPNLELMEGIPPCLKEIFDKFYELLSPFDMSKLLSGIDEDIELHQSGSARSQVKN